MEYTIETRYVPSYYPGMSHDPLHHMPALVLNDAVKRAMKRNNGGKDIGQVTKREIMAFLRDKANLKPLVLAEGWIVETDVQPDEDDDTDVEDVSMSDAATASAVSDTGILTYPSPLHAQTNTGLKAAGPCKPATTKKTRGQNTRGTSPAGSVHADHGHTGAKGSKTRKQPAKKEVALKLKAAANNEGGQEDKDDTPKSMTAVDAKVLTEQKLIAKTQGSLASTVPNPANAIAAAAVPHGKPWRPVITTACGKTTPAKHSGDEMIRYVCANKGRKDEKTGTYKERKRTAACCLCLGWFLDKRAVYHHFKRCCEMNGNPNGLYWYQHDSLQVLKFTSRMLVERSDAAQATSFRATSILEVLQYVKHAFDDEASLDTLPLDAAGNSGAWKAWRAYRRSSGMEVDDTVMGQQDEWSWDGVWEERVKKGIDASIAESTLYGSTGGGDDLIRFVDLDEDLIKEIKQQMLGSAL
ncbi:hypothetical protein P7C71_g2306, partial [Lecanoromycetidae sp. Uapishka_2]